MYLKRSTPVLLLASMITGVPISSTSTAQPEFTSSVAYFGFAMGAVQAGLAGELRTGLDFRQRPM
jgi:hypothetical protein